MSRRKGELSPVAMDRGWPHQVALPYDQCTGKNYNPPHAFIRGLSVCCRNHITMHEDEKYLVFCFADIEDALQFKEAFKGVLFYPEDRKGRNWNRPPGDVRRPVKRDPYDWSS
jgi:hypothetical protein